MTDTDTSEPPTRCLLLTGGDPGLNGLPCHICQAPVYLGHHFIAAATDGVTTASHSPAGAFLCAQHARGAAPVLAEVARALDLLRALAPGIEGQPANTLARALTEIAELCTVDEPALVEVPAR